MNQEVRNCQHCQNPFTIEPEDFTFYQKVQVPPPTWCPECRLVRRLGFRNERTLYRSQCARCERSMISMFSSDKKLTVYCRPCWWSDEWDGLEEGRDFDPTKPFLLQVHELFRKVPTMALHGLHSTIVNSDYTNMAGYLKKCYLLTQADYNENCAYGSFVMHSRDSIDNLMIDQCELCYENVNCRNSYQTFFSLDCEDCHDVYFSKNCVGCHHCIGCVNLRNKSYYIFNQSYTKEEYENALKNYLPTSLQKVSELTSKARDHWMRYPSKFMHERHNANVSGDYIYNCKNTYHSFIVTDAEDSRYCALIVPSGLKDSYDLTHYGPNSELVVDSFQVGNHVSRIRFSWWAVTDVQDAEYSMFVTGCRNVLGCVGLKKRKYCILNKQYSKEDYEALRSRIIEHMSEVPYRDRQGLEYRYGEFFPIEMSPFAYNETTNQELFPLTEEEVRQRGWAWKAAEKRDYQPTIQAEQLPDTIHVVTDSVLDEVIGCAHGGKCNENCTTAFKLIPPELEFYRKLHLPLPRLCPNCRHYQRLRQRNPLKLWHRQCTCSGEKSSNGVYPNQSPHPSHARNHPCPNEFETSYAPERPEIVYCEGCYQAEVV